MRGDGARVLLTGHGGDEMLCSNPSPAPEFGDLLVQRRLLSLHRSLKVWSEASQKSYLTLLWRDGVMPLLPTKLQISLKPVIKMAPWIDERFITRMNLRERYLSMPDVFGFNAPSGRDQAIGFLSVTRITSKASHRARSGIEVSHPYLHRPLVEFLQAIPHKQRVRPGETRSLMRRAFRDLLPEKILKRRSKRGPDEALLRALAREWPRLQPIFDGARVCARGYVNAEALQVALERARHGCEAYTFAMIQTISLEFWLRALENRSSTAKNAALLEGPATWPVAALPAAARAVRQPSGPQGTL